MNTLPMFSKLTDEWNTPDDLFKLLDEEFQFDFDAAASAFNTKVGPYFDKDQDALTQSWTHPTAKAAIWLNPPYSQIGRFMDKVVKEHQEQAGADIVCLLPARTETQWWWHTVKAYADEVRFLKGRLNFGLHVPDELFAYVVASDMSMDTLREITGLPKTTIMAIQTGKKKITTSAPFPSCVAVFRKLPIWRNSEGLDNDPYCRWWDWKKSLHEDTEDARKEEAIPVDHQNDGQVGESQPAGRIVDHSNCW